MLLMFDILARGRYSEGRPRASGLMNGKPSVWGF